MTGDPLDGLPRPPGDPGTVRRAGLAHLGAADRLGTDGQAMVGVLRGLLGVHWSGSAAESALGYTVLLATTYARAADAAERAGSALATYATALEVAQGDWDRARTLADQAVADEVGYRARAEQAAQALDAQATGPTGIGAAHAAREIRADAAGYVSPLRGRAVALATQAIQDATRAGRSAAADVHGATAAITPPPPPPKPKHHWYDQVVGFGEGLYHGVVDPLKMLGGLVNPFGDPGKHWEQLGAGLWHGITHPGDFGKALVDWQDLSHGRFGRWAGELLPSIAAAVATGGAGAAVKGVDGVTALERAGLTAADVEGLTDAQAARVIMRGAEPRPGMVTADGPLVTGKDLSFPGGPDAAIAKYGPDAFDGYRRVDGPLPDHVYVNAHDATQSLLGKRRSLWWGSSPKDALRVPGTEAYRQDWALPPAFQGHLDEMTVVHVPAGSPGTFFRGPTAAQLGHGPQFVGGATQTLNPVVVTDHAVWTGPLPWERVPDLGYAARGAARFAGAGLGVRGLDALSGCGTIPP